MIRGGGSQSDLNCFNAYRLASCIAQFPLPVITGIGHDRDETIADMVACVPLKTPTAVAEYLINTAIALDNSLQELARQISDTASLAIRRPTDRLQRLTQRLQTIMYNYVRVRDKEQHTYRLRLIHAAQTFLSQKKTEIRWLEEKLHLLDPVNLLLRGYSITLADGKTVRSAKTLKKGQRIETILYDGKVESMVE
jgi:exodeoxyribonuclease VII large subunit